MKNTNPINNPRKQSEQPLPPSRKHEYVYHWNRIVGAGVIFLLLCGLGGYGLYQWFGPAPEDNLDMAGTPPTAEVAVEDAQPKTEQEPLDRENAEASSSLAQAEKEKPPSVVAETSDSRAASQETETPQPNQATIVEESLAQPSAANIPLATASPAPEMAQLSTDDQTSPETVEEMSANELNLEDSKPATGAQPSPEMRAISTDEELSEPRDEVSSNIPQPLQEESPDSADTTVAVDRIKSPFQVQDLKILMPSVQRFLLAESVVNREPKGELNEINFTADGSAAVWVFSEVINQKGSRFKYVWLHDGKQIAAVPVRVGGNRWRSYASKVINQSMSGTWRVELHDGKGRLMASADFFVAAESPR